MVGKGQDLHPSAGQGTFPIRTQVVSCAAVRSFAAFLLGTADKRNSSTKHWQVHFQFHSFTTTEHGDENKYCHVVCSLLRSQFHKLFLPVLF